MLTRRDFLGTAAGVTVAGQFGPAFAQAPGKIPDLASSSSFAARSRASLICSGVNTLVP